MLRITGNINRRKRELKRQKGMRIGATSGDGGRKSSQASSSTTTIQPAAGARPSSSGTKRTVTMPPSMIPPIKSSNTNIAGKYSQAERAGLLYQTSDDNSLNNSTR